MTQNKDHACFPQALVSATYMSTSNFNRNPNGYLLFILVLLFILFVLVLIYTVYYLYYFSFIQDTILHKSNS